jgi:hypothetical protein
MGITNPEFRTRAVREETVTRRPQLMKELNDDGSGVEAFANFMTFPAPPPRGQITAQAALGELVFRSIGCAGCHRPDLRTGPNPVAALNKVTFHPYSDFLLHDMGSLGDGITQNNATGRLMRTAPLWGLRKITTYLHDGRATAVTDAILAHAGQGQKARDRFAALSNHQKALAGGVPELAVNRRSYVRGAGRSGRSARFFFEPKLTALAYRQAGRSLPGGGNTPKKRGRDATDVVDSGSGVSREPDCPRGRFGASRSPAVAFGCDAARSRAQHDARRREGDLFAVRIRSRRRALYDLLWNASALYRNFQLPVNSGVLRRAGQPACPHDDSVDLSTSFTQLLPTGGAVSLFTNWGWSRTNNVFTLLSPSYPTGAGISLTQPLLRNLFMDPAREGILVASADRSASHARLERTIFDTVTEVDSVYWDLVSARRNVASIRESVTLAAQQLSETKSRVEAGVLGETDIAQPTAERERRLGNLALAMQAVVRAENRLKRLILGDPTDPLWGNRIVPSDDPEMTLLERPSTETALDCCQHLVRARARIRRLPTQVQHWPRIRRGRCQ